MVARTDGAPTVHIRFEGRSFDIPVADLDIGALSSDSQIKQALARYLDVAETKFRDYVVDRHETAT